MATLNRPIDDNDYNSIRNRIITVMGTGNINPETFLPDETFGYGQTLISSPVNQGEIITKNQWDALRFDILNARLHQEGTIPSIVEANKGQAIRFGSANPNNQYNLQTTTAIENRFRLGAGQFVVESASDGSNPVSPVIRSTTWNSSLTCTVRVNFDDADHCRYFFNSGGRIRFSSSRSGGSATDQNTNWSALLNEVGPVEFAGISLVAGRINYYSLSSSYQYLINYFSSSYYSGNSFSIQARKTTVKQIEFVVQWLDTYIDRYPSTPPFDAVDGDLQLVVEEVRASSNLFPDAEDSIRLGIPTPGEFTIARPTFVISSISGS
jgi:hypothetical protein